MQNSLDWHCFILAYQIITDHHTKVNPGSYYSFPFTNRKARGQVPKPTWKGVRGSIFNSIQGFLKLLPGNLKLWCSFQKCSTASDRLITPDHVSTQGCRWLSIKDVSQCCLKETEQHDKSQFCNPQKSAATAEPIAASVSRGPVQKVKGSSGEQ